MKKIAIVSCYFQPNYGSMLQAYATQKAVTRLGYKVENLRIDGIAKEIRNAKLRYFARAALGDMSIIRNKLGMIKKALYKCHNRRLAANLAVRRAKFCEFKDTHFCLAPVVNGRDALKEQTRNYKAVLVGSDQLWLPSNIAADYYTLTFVPDEVKKISYATSFGVAQLAAWQKKQTKEFLSRFAHVSVREERGCELVSEVTDGEIEAQLVCDPTLLFDKESWANLLPPKSQEYVSGDYIFCYFLGDNPWQRNFAHQLQARTGLPIIAPLHLDNYVASDEGFPDYAPYDIGPEEFVNLIRGAAYVLTDSFHATVFSAIHEKNFATFRRFSGGTLSTNSRMESLYHLLGVPERLLNKQATVRDFLSLPIQTEMIGERLAENRLVSWNWLKEALGTDD